MAGSAKTFEQLIVCPDCDLLLEKRPVDPGQSLFCPRCNRLLKRSFHNSIDKTLALAITGLLLYLPAMLAPLMTFESFGMQGSTNIVQSIINFYETGYYVVSGMVLLTALVFPLTLLAIVFWLTVNLKFGRCSPRLASLFRMYLHLQEWAMIEVYLLGITITIIKMSDSTHVAYHFGVFCFTALVLATLAMSTTIDRSLFWRLLDTTTTQSRRLLTLSSGPTTAACQGLISCQSCGKISPDKLEGRACPRCGEVLHSRKKASVARTWALVITSALFLAPANLLPIMRVDFLGIPERSTIMDGIIYFFQDGAYLIGLVIFTASVLVPIFKIVGLGILLLTTKPCRDTRLKQKTRMFRLIAFIGRWSMLDIFVIALLTVLVDFGFFTSIHTAPAATYFCIVVATTMLAATTFDPRIMWDRCHPCGHLSANVQKMIHPMP